jgi:hypothetical protein
MEYGIKQYTIMAIEEIPYLYSKGMHPKGLAERHGMTKSPIKWPLVVQGTEALTYRTARNSNDK